MYKLDFEEVDKPENKLPTFTGSWRKHRNSRKTSTSASVTTLNPLTCVDHNKLDNSQTGIPDHLPCLLRNLYVGQKATVRTGYETIDLFKIGKGVCQGYIFSPYLFNLYAEYTWLNHKLELRLPGEMSSASGMQRISV